MAVVALARATENHTNLLLARRRLDAGSIAAKSHGVATARGSGDRTPTFQRWRPKMLQGDL